RKIST
ncbi:Insulinase (Peptidase family M16), partial [Haemophilus influenzae]